MNLFASFRPCRRLHTAMSGALIALLLGGAALAQAPASKPSATVAPPPVPAEPGTTTASYGDWVLRCQRVGTAEKSARLCEVVQAMQVQGQAVPIAQIAIGRPPGEADLRVTALLPVAVSFPSNVRIALGDRDTKTGEGKAGGTRPEDVKAGEKPSGLDLAWHRCLPGGCLADGPAPDAELKRWRSAEPPGRILFKDASGQEVAIPLSFRGLSPALDALAKERG